MPELPAESRAPQPGAATGGSDVPPAELSGGRLEPASAQPEEAREGPMAAAGGARLLEPAEEEGPESRPRPRNDRGLAALPYRCLRHPLIVLGITSQQFIRHYLENCPVAPGRIQALEGHRRRFVEAGRAREAAFDAEYQRNPQEMDFDNLTFTVSLTASEVISPLIEELGCDKIINRE